MHKIQLDRAVLSQFLPNHQAIREFEKVLKDVGAMLPDSIEVAGNDAASAVAAAQAALALLQQVSDALSMLLAAPAPVPQVDVDNMAPVVQVGTIAIQNHDAVAITGGRVGLDAGAFGAPSFYLNGEDTTGFYRIAADNWGWACAGVLMADWSATTWKLSFAGVLAVEWSVTASKWSYGAAETVLMDANGLEVKNGGYVKAAGGLRTGLATALVTSTTAMNNGAAVAVGTLNNAPAVGNPTKWIPINDNGTTRYIPAW